MSKENIIEAHTENTTWLNKLSFYKDDLKVFSHRLEEVAIKNTHIEVLAEVEKFQNQFIIQNNNIDQIKHIINLEEDKIVEEVNKNPIAVDRRKIDRNAKIDDLIETFENNFKEIRTNFNKFLSKVM